MKLEIAVIITLIEIGTYAEITEALRKTISLKLKWKWIS